MAVHRRPLKRAEEPFELRLQPRSLRLYLDDLENLVAYLRGRAERVTIFMQGVVVDEADDLRSVTARELATLAVSTANPTIVIQLYRQRTSVRTTEDSDSARSLAAEAHQLLGRHRSKRVVLSTIASAWPVAVLGLPMIAAVPFSDKPWRTLLLAAGVVVGLPLVYGSLAAATSGGVGAARIVLERRSDQHGLNAATRSQLRVGLVVGLVVAVVSVVLTRALGA